MTEMIRPTGHLGSMTPESEYFMVDNLISGIPVGAVEKVAALVAWPGIIFDAAVHQAAHYWRLGVGSHILIAGYHLEKEAKQAFSPDKLFKNYGVMKRGDSIHSQIVANHAGHQASWVAEKVKELNIESIGLFVPKFHMPRAYLTTIEAFRRVGVTIPIIPMSPPVSPFEVCVLDASPGGVRDKTTLDVINAEVTRMSSYSKQKTDGSHGDVATTEEFIQYLRFLYDHPIMRDMLVTTVKD